jgi:hypothetical protein
MTEAEFRAYFDALLARRSEATLPMNRPVVFADGTASQPSRCHENVDRWVLEHPHDSAVRGWAIISSWPSSCFFAAHSVVESNIGLIDITPQDYPVWFLRHEGEESIFRALQPGSASIIWPPMDLVP